METLKLLLTLSTIALAVAVVLMTYLLVLFYKTFRKNQQLIHLVDFYSEKCKYLLTHTEEPFSEFKGQDSK